MASRFRSALIAHFSLLLFAPAIPAQPAMDIAWLKDVDGDGAGDQVFLRFTQPLGALPDFVEAQWNSHTSAFQGVTGSRLAFALNDSATVIADFSAAPFPKGWTGIPIGDSPKARIPGENGVAWRTMPLLDSVGPVILEATLAAGAPHPGSSEVLDTLKVRLSERLKTPSAYNELFRFAQDCGNPGLSRLIVSATQPYVDLFNLQYIVVVEHNSSSPRAGGCLALTRAGGISDLSGNAVSESWQPLRSPGEVSVRRPAASGGLPGRDRERHTADGRRLSPVHGGWYPRGANLITFMGASPRKGSLDDYTLGHPEP